MRYFVSTPHARRIFKHEPRHQNFERWQSFFLGEDAPSAQRSLVSKSTMSAIAARKALLAAQAQETPSVSVSSSSEAGPSTITKTRRSRQQRDSSSTRTPSQRKKVRLEESEGESDAASESSASSRAGTDSASDNDEDDDDRLDTRSSSVAPTAEDERHEVDIATPKLRTRGAAVPQRNWWKARHSDGTKSKGNVSVVRTSDGGYAITIGLQEDEWLSFYGVAVLKVIKGQIEINHCLLTSASQPQRMLCPLTDPLPAIRAVSPSPQTGPAKTPSPLDSDCFSAVVTFDTDPSTGLELLPRVCPIAGSDPFGASSTATTASTSTATSTKRTSSAQSNDQIKLPFFHTMADESKVCKAPSSWSDALHSARTSGSDVNSSPSPHISLIRGPKGVGKSTFARSLLNTLAHSGQSRKVAFLDLDLGQPELNLPGTVSLLLLNDKEDSSTLPLLSPSWLTQSASSSASSHHHHHCYSHYLGQVTPKDIPSAYLSAIESLLSHLNNSSQSGRHRHRAPPQPHRPTHLVVNTMGWTKGLGSELSARIETLIRPDIIYDLQGRTMEAHTSLVDVLAPSRLTGPYYDAYGGVIHPGSKVVSLHGYHSALQTQTQAPPLTPADRRTLSIMTALHSTSSPTSLRWDFRRPLIEQKPFFVDVKVANLSMAYVPAIGGNASVNDEETQRKLMALNGELVALCSSDDDKTAKITASHQSSTSSSPLSLWNQHFFSRHGSPSPPQQQQQPQHLNFRTLAIVRAIDVASCTLHLLLPRNIDPSKLTTIVAAQPSISPTLSLPVWAHLDAISIKRAMRGWPAVSGDQQGNQYEDAIAGVPLDMVPFLDFPENHESRDPRVNDDDTSATTQHAIVGGQRRRVRRNLMRKNQM